MSMHENHVKNELLAVSSENQVCMYNLQYLSIRDVDYKLIILSFSNGKLLCNSCIEMLERSDPIEFQQRISTSIPNLYFLAESCIHDDFASKGHHQTITFINQSISILYDCMKVFRF